MKYIALLRALTIVMTLLSCAGVFLYTNYYVPKKKVAVMSIRQTTELPVSKNFTQIIAVLDGSLFKLEKNDATVKCLGRKDEDRMRVNRDLLNEISEGPLTSFKVQPGDLPDIVHYVWCGGKKFLFEDHLGFLSFVRIIRPVKIVFHYNELPKGSDYHTWFQIVMQSLPQLVIRKTDKQLKCDTVDSLNFGLEQLAASPGGGMYFGLRTALTYIPLNWKSDDYFSYTVPGSKSNEEIFLFTKFGLRNRNETFEAFKSRLLSKVGVCVDADKFNKEMKAYDEVKKHRVPDGVVSPCVVLPKGMYPKHIINVDTPFAANFRRIFYGKSDLLIAKPSQDPDMLIPLISHYLVFAKDPKQRPDWTFPNYMSVLSALYVAGFERVYIHGNQVPKGQWWDRLQTENVTFVYIERVETIYQQKVDVLAHDSDILRLIILSKYGGVYQASTNQKNVKHVLWGLRWYLSAWKYYGDEHGDNDVIWGKTVTEEVRKYPIVFSFDYALLGDMPGALNNGVIMSRAKSPFLQKLLEVYWLNKDHLWTYNGVEMAYKVYEMNPESVYIYDRLQVMCTFGVCHPTWHPDFLRPLRDMRKPTGNFSLDEALAYHFVVPKPDPSFVSFETIKKGTNIAAQLGQRLLKAIEKSGRMNLLA